MEMGSCGCLKMFSFFIKPSALWDNNSLYTFNSRDKFGFSLKLVLSGEIAPWLLPLCALCVNRRESSEWPVVINPARHTPPQGWARARLSSAIGRINSIHGFILRSLCSCIFLIKKQHTQNSPYLSPNPTFLSSILVAY